MSDYKQKMGSFLFQRFIDRLAGNPAQNVPTSYGRDAGLEGPFVQVRCSDALDRFVREHPEFISVRDEIGNVTFGQSTLNFVEPLWVEVQSR